MKPHPSGSESHPLSQGSCSAGSASRKRLRHHHSRRPICRRLRTPDVEDAHPIVRNIRRPVPELGTEPLRGTRASASMTTAAVSAAPGGDCLWTAARRPAPLPFVRTKSARRQALSSRSVFRVVSESVGKEHSRAKTRSPRPHAQDAPHMAQRRQHDQPSRWPTTEVPESRPVFGPRASRLPSRRQIDVGTLQLRVVANASPPAARRQREAGTNRQFGFAVAEVRGPQVWRESVPQPRSAGRSLRGEDL